jgi:hypothetical protein
LILTLHMCHWVPHTLHVAIRVGESQKFAEHA